MNECPPTPRTRISRFHRLPLTADPHTTPPTTPTETAAARAEQKEGEAAANAAANAAPAEGKKKGCMGQQQHAHTGHGSGDHIELQPPHKQPGRFARLLGAPATAMRCDRLAGVPRRLQKPSLSFAQLTMATAPLDMSEEDMSEAEDMMEGLDVEMGEGEGSVGLPISPSLSSAASSLSSSGSSGSVGAGAWADADAGAGAVKGEEEARALEAVVVGGEMKKGGKDEEEVEAGAGVPSWGARVRQALRPRKLKEKLLSFVVGVLHGVAGVSLAWGVWGVYGVGVHDRGGVRHTPGRAAALLASYMLSCD